MDSNAVTAKEVEEENLILITCIYNTIMVKLKSTSVSNHLGSSVSKFRASFKREAKIWLTNRVLNMGQSSPARRISIEDRDAVVFVYVEAFEELVELLIGKTAALRQVSEHKVCVAGRRTEQATDFLMRLIFSNHCVQRYLIVSKSSSSSSSHQLSSNRSFLG